MLNSILPASKTIILDAGNMFWTFMIVFRTQVLLYRTVIKSIFE